MREPRVRAGFPILATAVLGGLALLVMGVGAVALAAEFLNTWEHYFVMERVVAAATPVVAGLAVAAVAVGLAAVVQS